MANTLVANFGHPLSDDAQAELGNLMGELDIRNIRVQLDMSSELAPQVVAIVNEVGLSPTEWQTRPIVVVLPGVSSAAALVIAELHGRSGGFPRIVVLSRGEDGVFRLGEIIDLSKVRSAARTTR